jgi:hypothetical protein
MLDSARIEIGARVTVAPQRLRLERTGSAPAVSALAIALQSQSNAWVLEVHAELVPGRPWKIGEIVVPAPSSGIDSSRIVALACVPGARGWMVGIAPHGTPLDPDEIGILEIAASDVGLPVPLVPVAPAFVTSEVRSYMAGTLAAGATSITVPAGTRIGSVSAWQDGDGGTMAVLGGDAIPLPPTGTVVLRVEVDAIGVGSVTFAAIPVGGGGYLIELLGA